MSLIILNNVLKVIKYIEMAGLFHCIKSAKNMQSTALSQIKLGITVHLRNNYTILKETAD